MIVGQFTESNEAILVLTVSNPAGQQAQVRAVIDTGFTEFLVLPQRIVSQLSLPQVDVEELSLADGSIARFSVHEASVLWDGEPRAVPAYAADGGALVGVGLLRGSVATFEFVDGGMVTIEPAL